MQRVFDEAQFALAVQLAAGFLAGGGRRALPGDEMRDAVVVAYQALHEARIDILDELQQGPPTDGA
jgi:hypothetical protein